MNICLAVNHSFVDGMMQTRLSYHRTWMPNLVMRGIIRPCYAIQTCYGRKRFDTSYTGGSINTMSWCKM